MKKTLSLILPLLGFTFIFFSCKSTKQNFLKEEISLKGTEEFFEFTKINSGKSVLYTPTKNKKNITVAINAGHGTEGGTREKTFCHPDKSPKYISGSLSQGAREAYAVTDGTYMSDGTKEAEANLTLAKLTCRKLLSKGYSVLMIRDEDDVQLDNVSRTILANKHAQIHIALHYDNTSSDPGAFFCAVPDISEYKAMYPLSLCWEKHMALGECIIEGLTQSGVKIKGDGKYFIDLTQTSFSTIPSIDLEAGDRVSDRSEESLEKLADGIVRGIDLFFLN